MNGLSKVKSKFIGALKWILKEWLKALLAAIAILFLGFLGWVFRSYIGDWLISEHAIKIYGWLWVLILLLLISMAVMIFWLITRQRVLYTEEEDIKNILRKWRRHHTEGEREQPEFTLYFTSIDRQEKLDKGSTKKYLREIIEEGGLYDVESEGDETLYIIHRPEDAQLYTQ